MVFDNKIKGWAFLVAIIVAFIIEYYMIVVEQYMNFQTAFGTMGGLSVYLFVTIGSLIFLKLVFKTVGAGQFIKTYIIALIITIPIGLFWGFYQGYPAGQLFNLEWELTHDSIYTMLVSQFVVLAILLLGTEEGGRYTVEEW